ncbi:MAG: hypothetical protein AVDCRST_MAG04-3559, partial [uncultured Acetobacteraceae bacterium]
EGCPAATRARDADRDLVRRRSPRRPAGHADPRLGQAGLAPARAARPALHLGLAVRRGLPRAPSRRRRGHAGGEHRGHAGAPGRDQPRRRSRCARRPRARRCRLAHHPEAAGAREHQPVAAAPLRAGAQPGGADLGVPPGQLPEPSRVGQLRGDRRCVLPGLDRADAHARADRLHHHPALGTGQSL